MFSENRAANPRLSIGQEPRECIKGMTIERRAPSFTAARQIGHSIWGTLYISSTLSQREITYSISFEKFANELESFRGKRCFDLQKRNKVGQALLYIVKYGV